jgi:hypothetical protein
MILKRVEGNQTEAEISNGLFVHCEPEVGVLSLQSCA